MPLNEDYYQNQSTVLGGKVYFSDGSSDEEIIETITRWIGDSRSFHDLMLVQQNKCVRYYLGDQTDKLDIPPFQSDTVYNRIFEATETIIPIITASAHQFIALPASENERSVARARKVQQVLSKKYEEMEVQRHLENAARDIILKRYGVIKWFWDYELDDVNIKTVDPRLILIPKLKVDANDSPYVLELQEYTRTEIEDFFPDVNPDDLAKGRKIEGFSQNYDFDADNDVYQVIECWTPQYVVWKQGTRVLKRMTNPYFDFEGEEKEVEKTQANGKVKMTQYLQFSNFLTKPQMPYVFFNPFRTGSAPIAEASLAEIAIPIQDDINSQKRRIANNLAKMGNGQVYVDTDAIPEERFDEITSEPGLVIGGKNLASENRIRRDPGLPLPNAHFQNLQDSIVAFDNVFGVHGAVRGASSSQTLGGQILDRNQDVSRIEQLTRCLNRGVARLAQGLVQMMKLYYSEEHLVRIVGKDGAIEFIKFISEDIEEGMVIDVKSGVPVSLDPQARHNQAVQLWQLGAIDPETLYERLDFADPQLAAQKLFAWKSGNLVLESQIRQKEAQTAAQAKASASEDKGGIETPDNVIERAREGLNGGGRAPLSLTPNGGNPAAVA